MLSSDIRIEAEEATKIFSFEEISSEAGVYIEDWVDIGDVDDVFIVSEARTVIVMNGFEPEAFRVATKQSCKGKKFKKWVGVIKVEFRNAD